MVDLKKTAFMQAAVKMSEFFTGYFAGLRVAGACPYAVVLLAPEGMSTGGGAQATQHITLRPEVPGLPVLTVGWVNGSSWSAKLRTYAFMRALHEQRFGAQPFQLDPASYQTFFDATIAFLQSQRMQLEVEDAPALPAAPAKSSGGAAIAAALVVLGLALVGLVVTYFVSYRR